MNILKMLKKKKGVSPVIAVVLMIAVAVAIAVIVYAWATGFTSQKTGSDTAEAEQLILESQRTLSGGAVEVCIRNATNQTAVVANEYAEGALVSGAPTHTIGGKAVVCFNLAGTYVAGDEAMLVTQQGTQIKFKIKG